MLNAPAHPLLFPSRKNLIFLTLLTYIFDISNTFKLERPENIIFYSLDKSIKSYRQMAQNKLNAANLDITVDQWLVMNLINTNPEMSQQEMAARVFKDNASVTRIIELLVNKAYIKRTLLSEDRRRTQLQPTAKGKNLMNKALKVVNTYRRTALKGISETDLKKVRKVLDIMINNCEKHLN
jgi:MarR family transcriptional regulator, transcriptional regulator for hemolysin